MENVRISKTCCLCAGCKFAIDSAIKAKKTNKNVVLFKEIVHNKNVNKMLENQNIKTINDLSLANQDDTVIIRAHGEPPETFKYLNKNNINFVDCTCKNVQNIHLNVEKFSNLGYKIILIGKYGKLSSIMHPEVAGTIKYALTQVILIEDEEDILSINPQCNDKFYLVCQTTFNEHKADTLIEKLQNLLKNNELIINKSICNAQKIINKDSAELAKECDIMIVVGGKNSSNSLELYKNISSITRTIFIEDIYSWENELTKNNILFTNNTKFGVTAGASTLKNELVILKNLIESKLKEG